MKFLEEYFFVIWAILFFGMIGFTLLRGFRLQQKFGPIKQDAIVTQYDWASAVNPTNDHWMYSHSGSSRLSQIILTKDEFIIKSVVFFAHFANRFGLYRRIPMTDIKFVAIEKRGIRNVLVVEFRTDKKANHRLEIRTSKNEELMALLNKLRKERNS